MKRFFLALWLGLCLSAPAWAADDIQLNTGTGGDKLAADEIGAKKHQRMKCQFGDDGSATDCSHTNPLPIEGGDAHDAATTMNPLLGGVHARTTNPTAVADGDTARLMGDKLGRTITYSTCPRDLITQNTITLTSTTETTLIAAGGAGVFRDLTKLIISNESTAEVRVDIADATAGANVLQIDFAADGGGAVIDFDPPFIQTTANNNWTATLSGAVSSVYIFAQSCDQN